MVLDLLEERQGGERGRDYAYRILRHNIVTMRQPPGSILSEPELSEQLAMSRTPIREALILLKDEGLVDIVPQRGSRVSCISLRYVREGYFMRRVLESVMVKELAGHLTGEQIHQLKENLAAQEIALKRCDGNVSSEFFMLDDQMHRFLYQFSGRERMGESVVKVCSHYDRVRYLDTACSEIDQEAILEQHRTLYYYLVLGIPVNVDIDDFYQHHLGRWMDRARKVITTYPEYFVD